MVYNDHKAFAMLVARHEGDVRNFLLKLCGFDRDQVDDLAQETFIRVYKYLRSFKANAKFSTWLYRIAYNVYLDSKKKGTKNMNRAPEEYEASYNPEKALDAKLDFDTVISILREEEKVAIQLSYVKGMSHKEIATVLNCPIGTVKSHISRGKDKIRKYLINSSCDEWERK